MIKSVLNKAKEAVAGAAIKKVTRGGEFKKTYLIYHDFNDLKVLSKWLVRLAPEDTEHLQYNFNSEGLSATISYGGYSHEIHIAKGFVLDKIYSEGTNRILVDRYCPEYNPDVHINVELI